VSSPTSSVASWSNLDNVYQLNIQAAGQAIEDFLQSPTQTWTHHYLSPSQPSPALSFGDHNPAFIAAITTPQSPILFSPILQYPGYTDTILPSILLVNPLTDSPVILQSPTYHIRSPSPDFPTPEGFLGLINEAIAQLEKQENRPLVPTTQDAFAHAHLDHDLCDHIPLDDITVETLPKPILFAPIYHALSPCSPAPQPPAPLPSLPVEPPSDSVAAALFPQLFTTPICTTAADCHPHQYTVVYQNNQKLWYPQEEFIDKDFLCLILLHSDIADYPAAYVTPFRAPTYHNILIHSFSTLLPPIHMCAKVGHHPHSTHFPFGYLESSFLDSIKFLFSRFPPTWLQEFKGCQVPLVAYNFLDGDIALLCGHLHFTEEGIFFLNRMTCIEDLLHTQPQFAWFTCLSRVPVNPFNFILPPVETPL